MTLLCNQGCGTKVYIKDDTVYNIADHKLHKDTCMSLKIGKWWGGYYNTIPIDRIKPSLETCKNLIRGDRLSFSEMIAVINTLQSEMEFMMRQIRDQEKWNAKQKEEFAVYKSNLVQQQMKREERRKAGAKVDSLPTDEELANERQD